MPEFEIGSNKYVGSKLIEVILIDSPNYAANRKNPSLFGFKGMDPALVPDVVLRAHAIGGQDSLRLPNFRCGHRRRSQAWCGSDDDDRGVGVRHRARS